MMTAAIVHVPHRLRKLGWRIFRPTTIGVRALVLDADKRVLLVRHSYTAGWYLPGGGVERGESIVDGLRRELREELGIELTDTPSLLGLYSTRYEGKSDHVGVFVVEAWRRHSQHHREVAEADFFSVHQLPAETSPGTQRRVAEYLGSRPVDYVW